MTEITKKSLPLKSSIKTPTIIFALFLTTVSIPATLSSNNHAVHNANIAAPPFKLKPEYIGSWSAPFSEVTVRTEPEKWKFVFTKGIADFSITINSDKTVSGRIGQATFENKKLKKNWGLPPSWTGIIYIVECGKVGKLFDNDPLQEKEVWFSLSPINADGSIEVELRRGNFPMAGFMINRQ